MTDDQYDAMRYVVGVELQIIKLRNKIDSAEIKIRHDNDLSEDDKENLQWDIWDWEAEIRDLKGGE
jgi:hypothetical protein